MFNSLSLAKKYTELDKLDPLGKGTEKDEGKFEVETKLEFNAQLSCHKSKNLNSEQFESLYDKRIIKNGNYLQNMTPEPCLITKKGSIRARPVHNGRDEPESKFNADPEGRPEGSNNEVKRKIREENKTKSRSNKWNYIISEKSRKHIILGCDGETYFDKLVNFNNTWWNYYIIRKCNTGEILYEYHSPIQDKIRLLHSRFKPPYVEFPNKINEFLNYSDEFINYNIENTISIINDNKIDEYTELYLYFNNGLRIEENSADYFKLDSDYNNEPKYIESNIEQYYSFCNNISVYVGWVSIIRINNYSAQPTYYNDLIKRYHKEWVNMLKYWVDVPNNNMKWNSNTKMNDTNLMATTINKDILPYPFFYIYQGIRQNNNYALHINNGDVKGVETMVNLSYEPNIFEPFIPNKYRHRFNDVEITIKKITKKDALHNKYKGKGWRVGQENKLPWGIKELVMDDIEKHSREFVKIRPKFK
jgi:hypothetical protein